MRRTVSLLTAYTLCIFFVSLSDAHASRDVYTDDNTLKKVLDNGVNVVIHEMRGAPIAAIDVLVGAGSAAEGRYAGSGISHLVEHMLFKDDDKTGRRVRIKSMGGDINGFTSHEYSGYTMTVGSKNTGKALEILKEMILLPSFDAIDLKKEKEVVLSEIRQNRDDPAGLASDLSWSLVFKEHPYQYPVIGYEDLLNRLEKRDLEEYHRQRYSPHNMIISVSGDVKKESLLQKISEIYGDVERNPVPLSPQWKEPRQLTQRSREERRPVSLAHVALSFKSVPINDPDLYPMDIIAMALGDGKDSILTRRLRDEKKLVYGITCRNYTLRESGVFSIYFTSEPSKVDEAISAALQELTEVKERGISDADIEKSKKSAAVGLLGALETAEGRARDMATSEALAHDYKFSQFYIDKLSEVTARDIQTAARAYLTEESLNKVLVLPEKETAAEAEDERPQRVKRTVVREFMPNGMRLLVSEDRSSPLCSISALFLGGVRSENDSNNGISYLVSKLLLDGTKNRNERDIKSGIESLGGSISSISGSNSFGITLNLLADDWSAGLDIIADIVLNSVFDEKKIEKEKSLALAAIRQRDDDVVRSGFLLFKRNFFETHPYRFDPLGTKECVEGIARDDIVNHYASLGVPRNMVLTVTGGIDTEKVISEANDRLGPFKGPDPKLPAPEDPGIPNGKKELSAAMPREQSLVLIGFPSVDIADNDRYIFEVIEAIMSGINGRMFTDIRDRLGMSYLIGSTFIPGIEPGTHIFYAAASRRDIESVKNAILEEIKELKKQPVAEEELKSVKEYLISSRMSGMQRDQDFNMKVSLDELYGLGYDNFEKYEDGINGVTAGQVKRVAAQYFDMDKSLIVFVYGSG